MENEKTPLYVAFSNKKGGVGKTTFTVLAASYLYYLKGYDVSVVDCDSVSYTHLDVYKRQVLSTFIICAMLCLTNCSNDDAPTSVFTPEALKPVSYTHLDVYKRQGCCSRPPGQKWPAYSWA